MTIRKLFTPFAFILAVGIGAPVLAGDADLCLDCHEPAEDWEGMSADEILAKAKDAGIKRHADNAELSDEQLAAMIAELMAD
jgi:Na+-translocating ferredoxin:NAD+ oxidoreductase RnfC subunit